MVFALHFINIFIEQLHLNRLEDDLYKYDNISK